MGIWRYEITIPSLLDHLEQIRPLLAASRIGLVVDYDGTIAEIAPTPGKAAISPSARESLHRLAQRLALVCVISGRSANDVRDRVGLDGVTYLGNHGAEYLARSRSWVAPGVAQHREKLQHFWDYLRTTVVEPGLIWDDKVLSMSVHYRAARDPERARRRLAEAARAAPGADGLDIFWGKMVLEIRAPGGVDKGYGFRAVARESRIDIAILMGDDTTDRDMFVALSKMRRHGQLRGIGVAVLHADSPEELVKSADYGLDGVGEAEKFLKWLAKTAGKRG